MKGVLFVVALTITFLSGLLITKQVRVHGASSNDKPYTLITVSYGVNNGQSQDYEKVTLMHRSDGATSESSARQFGKDVGTNSRRVDFPDGAEVLISDDAHVKSTIKLKLSPAVARDSRTCALPGQPVDGQEMIGGHKAIRFVSPLGSAGSTVISTTGRVVELFLPDFNCAAVSLQEQHKDASSGEWVTNQGFRLVSITEGEPSASLFTGFDNYTESTVSEFKKALLLSHGVTEQACPHCFDPDKSGDLYYGNHRP